jgi:carboxyl-terminal processing protease
MKRIIKQAAGLVLWAGGLAVALAIEANAPVPLSELKPGPDDGRIAYVTARLMEQGHYSQHKFDDEYSARMLHLYLESLDPQHMHFLQSDLDKFEPYRNRLDELTLRRGDTWPAYEIFTTFRQRLEQRTAYVEELLKAGKFDFSKDERVMLNRKDQSAPAEMAAARQIWRDRLRFEFLQEKLARVSEKKKPVKVSKSESGAAEAGWKSDVGWKTNAVIKIDPGTNAVSGAAKSGNPPASDVKPKKTEDEEIAELLGKRYRRNLHIFQEMDRDDVIEIYLTALTHSYDPHSDYFGKSQMEQFRISMNLALFGIGAQLQLDDDGYCKIKQLMPGGPAIKSEKIKEDDRIVAVAQSNSPPVDVVGMNLNKTVQLIRGTKGTEVTLTLESDGSTERHDVTLIRDEIPLEDQQAKAKIIDLPAAGDAAVRVGVIDLPSFYAPVNFARSAGAPEAHYTSVDVALLIKKMKEQGVRGIVLDLRRNGGGSLEEAIKLTGLFIKEGPVVQVCGHDGEPTVDSDTDPAVLWDGPLVVLTSRFSASASEIVAAALQDYGRALLVGDVSTHGKGTVQSLNPLQNYLRMSEMETTNDPGTLKFTIKKFYRASGASTQFEGVLPDIVLPDILNVAKDIGEKSLDYPLPWDTIESAKYDKLDRVAPYLAELKKDSDLRLAKSKDFGYIREDIAQYLKRQADKTVSLNLKERLKEKAEDDARQKARDKERLARTAPEPKVYAISLKQAEEDGLPAPLSKTNSLAGGKSTGDIIAAHTAAVAGDDEGDDSDKAPTVDATLDETEAILVDYLHLLDKVVTAKK